jgi:thioredoxin-related protein
MRNFFLSILAFSTMSFVEWHNDFETAQQIAIENNQLILLNFSGSDWCAPCIRMRQEIFEDKQFISMADTTVVLLNADFPRNKKNQLPKQIQTQNERLAEKYNTEGKFPFTVLLDANGKVIKTWDGLPRSNGEQFSAQVKKAVDEHTGKQ